MQLGKMMKQAQKMMKDMQKAKEDLANRVFEGSAGGGMVAVQCTGEHKLTAVRINPQCVDPEDVGMLEDLILTAVNDAISQAAKQAEQEMGKFGAGLNLPI